MLSLVGCAITRERFRSNPGALSNASVCVTLNRAIKAKDFSFAYFAREELEKRRIQEKSCNKIIADQDAEIAAATVLMLGTTAIVAASLKNRGGGGDGIRGYAPPIDTEWDWDQFYNDSYQLVWACRGVQTGQFADEGRCYSKFQTDSRWPQK